MGDFRDDLHAILQAEWEPKGFQHIRGFRWVEQKQGPIRRMFAFEWFKGATLGARWGFSLDFVPKFRGRKLRWKRTPKSADMDLTIGPADIGRPADWFEFSYISGYHEQPSKSWLGRVVSHSAQAARHDFARVATVEDLVRMFEERAQSSDLGWSLEIYIQTHLAWLALIATGKQAEGESHVLRFCERFEVEWSDPLLLKAEAEAVRYAAAPLA